MRRALLAPFSRLSLLLLLAAGCLPQAVLVTEEGGDCPDPLTWFPDGDGDGHGDAQGVSLSCAPIEGYVAEGDDCDDADANRWEGEVVWPDEDGDGYGLDGWQALVCGEAGEGMATVGGDCDDTNPTVYEGARPICGDEVDNNCDGATDCSILTGALSTDDAAATLTGSVERRFGVSLAAPGDLTGDGVDDLLVGMVLSEESPAVPGQALLFSGPILQDAEAESAMAFSGAVAGDLAGTALSAAGDLDEDGYLDALVGVPGGGGAGQGVVYPIFGPVTEGDLLGASGVALVGVAARDRTGATVVGAGDLLGGDGLPEVLVGAPGSTSRAGAVYLALGPVSAGEIALGDATTWTGGSADALGEALALGGDLDGDGVREALVGAPGYAGATDGAVFAIPIDGGAGAAVDAALGWVVGPGGDRRFGWSVTGIGDVDGDGADDLLIGAPYATAPARPEAEPPVGELARAGAGYLVSGAVMASATGGVILDEVEALSWVYGPERDAELGALVLAPGDIDEDGTPDLCLGAPGDGDVALVGGALYCWYDLGAGERSTESADFTLYGDEAGDHVGQVAIGVGDVNGFAVPDLLVAAPGDIDAVHEPARVMLLLSDGL